MRNRIFNLAMAATAAFAGAGCGSPDTATAVADNSVENFDPATDVEKTYSISGFSKINGSVISSIHFTQANDYSVRMVCSKSLESLVRIRVSDNTLTLSLAGPGLNDMEWEGKRFDIYVSAPRLEDLNLSGAARFTAGAVTGNELDIDLSGASGCEIGRLECDEADINLSGASGLTAEVEAGELEIDLTGASKGTVRYKGGNIDIKNSGASVLEIEADCNNLKSDCSGASRLSISGTAESTKIENSGVSKTDTGELNEL